jgi:DNA-binding response OmpR family regulator
MQTRGITEFYKPVLLIDPQTDKAVELAAQLELNGFSTCVETNASDALIAIKRSHFATLILIADIDDPARLGWLDALRRRAARSWIIVVCPHCDTKTCNLIYRHGGDVCMTAPLSFYDLTRRLTAFQLRSRPVL